MSLLRCLFADVMFTCSRWVDLFREQCRQGVDGKWSKSLNMTHEVNYLVFDILGDLCFGKQFNMKEPDSDLKHIPELMASFLQTLAPVSIPPISYILGSMKRKRTMAQGY
jgi:hypothetical protein